MITDGLNPYSSLNEDRMRSLVHYGPVTSLKIHSNYVIAGYGPRLKIFEVVENSYRLIVDEQVFSRNKIHVISVSVEGESIFVGGSRSFSVINFPALLKNEESIVEKRMNEWIISALFLDENTLLVLNSHNIVLSIKVKKEDQAFILEDKIHCNEKSILYSGSIQKVSDDKILIAAGTVMNGVIVWDLRSRSIICNLKSHEGSIFGVKVHISGKYIISCSDDRSIQLSEVDSGHLLATGWGHGSRIWNLDFFKDSSKSLKMCSVGEDCSVRVWEFDGTDKLLQTDCWEGVHLGKHIWASDVDDANLKVIVTGGADGKIRFLDLQGREPATTYSMADISKQTDVIFTKNEIIKQFVKFPGLDMFIALTSKGNIIRLDYKKSIWASVNLTDDERNLFENFSPMQGCTKSNTLMVVSSAGHLLILNFDNGLSQPTKKFVKNDAAANFKLTNLLSCTDSRGNFYLLMDCPNPNIPMKLLVFRSAKADSHLERSYLLQKPNRTTFSATCMQVCSKNGYIILGSRFSSLALYKISSEDSFLEPSQTFKKLTPGDTVTSISIVRSTKANLQLMFTVRDGYYMFAKIEFASSFLTLSPLHLNKLSKGFLEGGWFENNDLILYGFKSSTFYVWNDTKQVEVYSEVCGGSHRQWRLFNDNFNFAPCFVYINKSNMHIKEFKTRFSESNYGILSEGTHGREIRSIAISPEVSFSNTRYVMTASEDSTIKLGSLNGSGMIDNFWTMNNHVSGLQTVAFINHDFAASSAANEEFYIWKITTLQSSKIPSIIEYGRIMPESASPDLRIMDFSAVEMTGGFMIATVYSDSNIKILFFDVQRQSFTVKRQGRYKKCCILNVEILRQGKCVFLLISSTDGFVSVWDISDIEEDNGSHTLGPMIINQQIHQNGIRTMAVREVETGYKLITGGDDNALALSTIMIQDGSMRLDISCYIADAASSTITSISLLNNDDVFVTSVDQINRVWSYKDRLTCISASYTTVADTGCSDATTINGEELILVGGAGLSSWKIEHE